MVAIARTGVHFKEPWQLLPQEVLATNIATYDGASADTSATADFWTSVAQRGTALDTDFTANTYKTLLSVSSGKGLVAALVGPTAGGSETTTFEITVDGFLTEIAVAVSNTHRAFLGKLVQRGIFTGASLFSQDVGAFDAGKTTIQNYAEVFYVPNWRTITNLGTPCLRFDSSLLVRVKHSANITGTASKERQCGIIHRTGL